LTHTLLLPLNKKTPQKRTPAFEREGKLKTLRIFGPLNPTPEKKGGKTFKEPKTLPNKILFKGVEKITCPSLFKGN